MGATSNNNSNNNNSNNSSNNSSNKNSNNNSNNNYNIFPNRIIKKNDKSSYIITTMQSLSQIFDLSNYFIKKEKPKQNNIIAGDFKEYLENLWKNNNEIFTPTDFISKLKNINRDFTLKEELEPYKFYDFILKQLNDELNGFDPEINNYFTNFNKKYDKFKDLKNQFLEEFIKNNNSIISIIFYGIMEIKNDCDGCKRMKQKNMKNLI